MDTNKLREKTEKQLDTLRIKAAKEMEKLAMSVIRGKESNFKKIGNLKKEYAKILTVLNEKRRK